MLVIAVIIPLLLSLLKLKFIPVLVIEIVCGIIIGNIPAIKELFIIENTHSFNTLVDGVYTIGLAVLLFMSGLEIDYSVLRKEKKKDLNTLPAFKISWILIVLVILVSFGLSFVFINDFVNNNLSTKIIGITLLTIIFSSSFASIIIPLIHDDKLAKTTMGKIISTYSTIAEFISILSLSILMIVLGLVDNAQPWLLIIVLIILLLIYVIRRFVNIKIFERMLGGIVHLDVTFTFLVLLILAFLTQRAGAEFILGTFLAGAIIKTTGINKNREQKITSVGYGLFIPMFYILVGLKASIMVPFKEFMTFENLLLVGKVFICLLIAKLPLMILGKWFKIKTTITSAFLVTTTIIVGLACEHFGIFTEELMCAIIIASTLTCVIPPILLYLHKNFGYSKDKYDPIIINPNEVEDEE